MLGLGSTLKVTSKPQSLTNKSKEPSFESKDRNREEQRGGEREDDRQ